MPQCFGHFSDEILNLSVRKEFVSEQDSSSVPSKCIETENIIFARRCQKEWLKGIVLEYTR